MRMKPANTFARCALQAALPFVVYIGFSRAVGLVYPLVDWFMLVLCAALPLLDRRVRTAMSLLTDREGMIENLLFGLGEPVIGPIHKFRCWACC